MAFYLERVKLWVAGVLRSDILWTTVLPLLTVPALFILLGTLGWLVFFRTHQTSPAVMVGKGWLARTWVKEDYSKFSCSTDTEGNVSCKTERDTRVIAVTENRGQGHTEISWPAPGINPNLNPNYYLDYSATCEGAFKLPSGEIEQLKLPCSEYKRFEYNSDCILTRPLVGRWRVGC